MSVTTAEHSATAPKTGSPHGPLRVGIGGPVGRFGFVREHARRRAAQVADAYRLYPRVIDTHVIEAARVEAKLRRATV